MCGICYAKSLVGQPVQAIVRQQFKNQRSRGTDGFGFVANLISHAKTIHKTDEAQIIKALRNTMATEILFHHRLPTSTDNVLNACHPFRVEGIKTGKNYYLVHNGIVWNDDELKLDHEKRGIEYTSIQPDGRFNDSEALAIEVMLLLEGAKYTKTFNARGSIAFICLECDENNQAVKLHYSRNSGSPLKLKNNGKTIQISSEGSGNDVPIDKLFTLDYETGKTTEKHLDIKTGSYAYSYGNYYGTSYEDNGYGLQKVEKRYKQCKEFDDRQAKEYPEYEEGFVDTYEYSYQLSSTEIEAVIKDLSEDIGERSTQYTKVKSAKRKEEILDEIGTLRNELAYYLGARDGWEAIRSEAWSDSDRRKLDLDYERSWQ